MGGLNSGPGPGITLLIAIVLVLTYTVLSAPLYEEDEGQENSSHALIESHGCYYNFQHYNEGERILTNEPCLNCTCRNRMLMCYLRVCPFTKGIGQNCTVEKVPGQCCPIITCPEVPVQLLTSTTTEGFKAPGGHHGTKGAAVGHLDTNGCNIDGIFYPNGAQVPGSSEKPCELCYCIRNKTACIMQECALHVDGCRPVYEEGQCFPVRYQCDDSPYEEEHTTTIRPAPTAGLIITTTSSEPLDCSYNNEVYEDGSRIQTEDPCEHCYCLKGKIACAVQECGVPLEKEGQNCTALPPAPGKCCPDSYQCDVTMTSQTLNEEDEGTTESVIPSVAIAGHPADGYHSDNGTKTTEKPRLTTVGLEQISEEVTPTKEILEEKPVVTPHVKPEELDKGTQKRPTESYHLEGLQPTKPSSISEDDKITFSHHDDVSQAATGSPAVGQMEMTETDHTADGHVLMISGQKGPKPESGSHVQDVYTKISETGKPDDRHKPLQGADDKHPEVHSSHPHDSTTKDIQDVSSQTASPDAKDTLLDKLHNIIQDVQAQVSDGRKTTETPEQTDYQTSTHSQTGHFTDKADIFAHLSQFGFQVSTPGSAISNAPDQTSLEDGSNIINKLQGIISDIYSHVTESVMSTKTPEKITPYNDAQSSQTFGNNGVAQPEDASEPEKEGLEPQEGSQHLEEPVRVQRPVTTTVKDQLTVDTKEKRKPDNGSYGTGHPETTGSEDEAHVTQFPDVSKVPDSSSKPYSEYGDPGKTGVIGAPDEGTGLQSTVKFPQRPKPDDDHLSGITEYPEATDKDKEEPNKTEAFVTNGPLQSKYPEKPQTGSSVKQPAQYPQEGKPVEYFHEGYKPGQHPQSFKPTQEYPHDVTPTHQYPEKAKPTGQLTEGYRPGQSTEEIKPGQYPQHVKPTVQFPEGHKPYLEGTKPVQQSSDRTKPMGHHPIVPGQHYPEEARPTEHFPESYEPGQYIDQTKPGQNYPDGVQPTKMYPDEEKPTEQYFDVMKPEQEYPHEVKPTELYPEGGKLEENLPERHKPGQSSNEVKPTEQHYGEFKPTGQYSDELKPGQEFPYKTRPTGQYPEGHTPNKYSGVKPVGQHSEGIKPTEHLSEEHKPGQSPQGLKPEQTYPEGTKPVQHYPGVKPIGQYSEGFYATGQYPEIYTTEYPEDVKPDQDYTYGSKPAGQKNPDSFKPGYYPQGQIPGQGYTGGVKQPEEYPQETTPIGIRHDIQKPNQYPGVTEITVQYPDGSKPTGQYAGEFKPNKHIKEQKPGQDNQHGIKPMGSYPEGRPIGHFTEGHKPNGDLEVSKPGEKYPEGINPEEQYPDGVQPTGQHFEENKPSKYPEGTKPGQKYPEKIKPLVQYPAGLRPTEQYPDDYETTGKYPGQKYPYGVKPTGSYQEEGELTGHFPERHRPGQHPVGMKPEQKYPEEISTTEQYPVDVKPMGQYTDRFKPTGKYPGQEYPEGVNPTELFTEEGKPVRHKPGQHPQILHTGQEHLEGYKPIQGLQGHKQGQEYPHGAKPTEEYPVETSIEPFPDSHKPDQYPIRVTPGEKYSEGISPTEECTEEVEPTKANPDGFELTGQYPDISKPGQKHSDGYKPDELKPGAQHPLEKFPPGVRPAGQQSVSVESAEKTKPLGSINFTAGIEYPGVVTGEPQEEISYPEQGRPTGQLPEKFNLEFTGTGRPTEQYSIGEHFGLESTFPATEYSEAVTKPVEEAYSAELRPTEKYTEENKPSDGYPEGPKYPAKTTESENIPPGTESPEEVTGKPYGESNYPEVFKYPPAMTGKPHGLTSLGNRHPDTEKPGSEKKPPEGFRPTEEYPIDKVTVSESSGTEYPEQGVTVFPIDFTKYPEFGMPGQPEISTKNPVQHKPEYGSHIIHRPEGTKESDRVTKIPEALKPEDLSKYPDEHKPIHLGNSKFPGTIEDGEKPEHAAKYPEGYETTTEHPGEYQRPEEHNTPSKYVTGSDGTSYGVKHPDAAGIHTQTENKDSERPDDFGKYPEGVSGKPTNFPGSGSKHPSSYRPHESTEKYPQETKPEADNEFTDKDSAEKYSDGTEKPSVSGSPAGFKPTAQHTGSRYPQKPKPVYVDKENNSKYSETTGQYLEGNLVSEKPDVDDDDKYLGKLTVTPESGNKYSKPQYETPGTDRPDYSEESRPSSVDITGHETSEYDGLYPGVSRRPIKRPQRPKPDDGKHSETSEVTEKYPGEADVTKKSPQEPNSGIFDYVEPGVTDQPEGNREPETSHAPNVHTQKRPESGNELYGTEVPDIPGYTKAPDLESNYLEGVIQDPNKYPEGSKYTDKSKVSGSRPHDTEYPKGNSTTQPSEENGTDKSPVSSKYPDDDAYNTQNSEKPEPPSVEDHLFETKPETELEMLKPEDETQHPGSSKPNTSNPLKELVKAEGTKESYPISKSPAKPGSEGPEETSAIAKPHYPGFKPQSSEKQGATGTADDSKPHFTLHPESDVTDTPPNQNEYQGKPKPGQDYIPVGLRPMGQHSEVHKPVKEYPEGFKPAEQYPDGQKPGQNYSEKHRPTGQHPTEYEPVQKYSEKTTEQYLEGTTEQYPEKQNKYSTIPPYGEDVQGTTVFGEPDSESQSPHNSKHASKPEVNYGPYGTAKPFGTEYPEGNTNGPEYFDKQPVVKLPGEEEKYPHKAEDETHDTKYPETGTGRPYEFDKLPEGVIDKSDVQPHGSEHTEYPEISGKPEDEIKYPEEHPGKPQGHNKLQATSDSPFSMETGKPEYNTEYPKEFTTGFNGGKPQHFTKYPEGFPDDHTSLPDSKYPESSKPEDHTKYPEEFTPGGFYSKATTERSHSSTKHPESTDRQEDLNTHSELGVKGKPETLIKYPERFSQTGPLHGKPQENRTEYPDKELTNKFVPTEFPESFETTGNYPTATTKPHDHKEHPEYGVTDHDSHPTKKPHYPEHGYGIDYPKGAVTGKPEYQTEYPGGFISTKHPQKPLVPSKYPESGRPHDLESPYGTEYPKVVDISRPKDQTKYPYGKPEDYTKYPESFTPMSAFGKPQDLTKFPVGTKYPEGFERPSIRPEYSTKYPEGGETHGTEHPENFELEQHSSSKYPWIKQQTDSVYGADHTDRPLQEYPIEGKPLEEYPERPEQVGKPLNQYSGQGKPSESGRPDISSKYPMKSKPEEITEYSEGVSGKPNDESVVSATEYSNGSKDPVKGKPHDLDTHYGTEHTEKSENYAKPTVGYGSKYPTTYQPQDRQKPEPDDSYDTEQQEAKDKLGKYTTEATRKPDLIQYPEESTPISDNLEYNGRPHGTIKHPHTKPETKFPGKPESATNYSEKPEFTNYPEADVTDILVQSKHPEFGPTRLYPEGSERPQKPKPSGSDVFFHSTEYPEPTSSNEVGVTELPGQYPGEQHPHTGSEGKPYGTEFSNEIGTSKYTGSYKPEFGTEQTIKRPQRPTGTENKSQGTDVQKGTKRPEGTSSEYQPHGTEYFEFTGTSEYPEGFKPTGRHPEGSERPHVSSKLPQKHKPDSTGHSDSTGTPEEELYVTENPDESGNTIKPEGEKFHEVFKAPGKPNDSPKHPQRPKPEVFDDESHAGEYPETTDHPDDTYGTEYPDTATGRPVDESGHADGFRPKPGVLGKPQGSTEQEPLGTEYPKVIGAPVSEEKAYGTSYSEKPVYDSISTKYPGQVTTPRPGTSYLPFSSGRPTEVIPSSEHFDENSVSELTERPLQNNFGFSNRIPASSTPSDEDLLTNLHHFESNPDKPASADLTHVPGSSFPHQKPISKYPGQHTTVEDMEVTTRPGDKTKPIGFEATQQETGVPVFVDNYSQRPKPNLPGEGLYNIQDSHKHFAESSIKPSESPADFDSPTQASDTQTEALETFETQKPRDEYDQPSTVRPNIHYPDSSTKYTETVKPGEEYTIGEGFIRPVQPSASPELTTETNSEMEYTTIPSNDNLINKLHHIISGIQSQSTAKYPQEIDSASSFGLPTQSPQAHHPLTDHFDRPVHKPQDLIGQLPKNSSTPDPSASESENKIYQTTVEDTEDQTGKPDFGYPFVGGSTEYSVSVPFRGPEGIHSEQVEDDESSEFPYEQSGVSEHPDLSTYKPDSVKRPEPEKQHHTKPEFHVPTEEKLSPEPSGKPIHNESINTIKPANVTDLSEISPDSQVSHKPDVPQFPEDISSISEHSGKPVSLETDRTTLVQDVLKGKPYDGSTQIYQEEKKDKKPAEDTTNLITEDIETSLHTVVPETTTPKHSSSHPTNKPLHLVYPTYYPDGVVTRKPSSKPDDATDKKITVTPQNTVSGNSSTQNVSEGDETVYEVYTEISSETATTSPVVIIQEVHTEVHSERATTKPDTEGYVKQTIKPEGFTQQPESISQTPQIVFGRPAVPAQEGLTFGTHTLKPEEFSDFTTKSDLVTITPTGYVTKESEHIMHLYSPKDKHPSSSATYPETVLYTTEPDVTDIPLGNAHEPEILETRFPSRKTTQKPTDGVAAFQETLTITPTLGLGVEQTHHGHPGMTKRPPVVFSTEGLAVDKYTTSTFTKNASYVPFKLINGTKIYYPEKEQLQKPIPGSSPFDGYDHIPYEIINGTKFFYPNRFVTTKPTITTITSSPLFGMYVPYKIVSGTKIYYTQDKPEKPEKFDGLDYVPFEVINGMKVFYPEKVTTTTSSPESAMYVPFKIINNTKVYYPKDAQEEPQDISDEYDGFDSVPYDVVNGNKVFHPDRIPGRAPEQLPAMYVPYKIINGNRVYYPKYAQTHPELVPEEYDGFVLVPYKDINGTKIFYSDRVTTLTQEETVTESPFHYQFVPFKIISGTKVYFPNDAQDKLAEVPENYDGFDHLPYEKINGTKVFRPEQVTAYPETVSTPAFYPNGMFVPYKTINNSRVFFPKDAQHKPRPLKPGYDGVQYLLYDIVNGTKVFYPETVTTPAPRPGAAIYVPYSIINGTKNYHADKATENPEEIPEEFEGFDYVPYEIVNGNKLFHPDRVAPVKGMYLPYKKVNGNKVYYPNEAAEKRQPIPEGYEGIDYVPYDIINGTKIFRPEVVTERPILEYSQGMFVPYKIINGTKVYYPQEAHKRPHPLSDEYAGLDYIPYEVVNGTNVFHPERVTPNAGPAMYVPYKLINGTKVYHPKYAQQNSSKIPSEYDGFDHIPYDIVNGTRVFYPTQAPSQPEKYIPYKIVNGVKQFYPDYGQGSPTPIPPGFHGVEPLPDGNFYKPTEQPSEQAMFVPFKIVNSTKVYYPKYAQHNPYVIPEGFEGFDYIPYEIVNGTKLFDPERAAMPGTIGNQALYVPYKIINGKKVYHSKYAQQRPELVPEGFDGFDHVPYEIVNGSKVFHPEKVVTPNSFPGMYVPYKIIQGVKVYQPKLAQDKPTHLPDGYEGFDYLSYNVDNGNKVFYPEPSTLRKQAMYVPYKIVNEKKIFYPKYAQHVPIQTPEGYDGLEYISYEIVNGEKVFHPEQAVATESTLIKAMYVPYRVVNGTKVYYPKNSQYNPNLIPSGYDGFDYLPYEIVNGNKIFRPAQILPETSKQALFVPFRVVNGTKVYYPNHAQSKPQPILEGYDGFDYLPYEVVNGTKVFSPKVPSTPTYLQGMYVPYKLSNHTKVFYPKDAHNKPNHFPQGYDGADYVPYESVNNTKMFYPELISTAQHDKPGSAGVYVPFNVINNKKVFYPKEATPFPPTVRYPYDGVAFVPYKASPSEIVYVDNEEALKQGIRPGHVPGEGSCYLNSKTFTNNTEIPPVSPCQARCVCVSSVIRCVRVKCPSPPENKLDCSAMYREGSCCPTYTCGDSDYEYPTTVGYTETKVPELYGSSSVHGIYSTTPSEFGAPKRPGVNGGSKPEVGTSEEYHLHKPPKPKPGEHESLEPYDNVEGQPSPDEDYDVEDEEPYGPGTCRYAGKVYVSAQQIPRDDPCDFCFCFRSDIICLQQSCPPPIPGCRDEPIQGFCCPRYECHVKMATLLNVTSTTTTTTTTLPPHFFPHAFKGQTTKTGCFVQGRAYRVGQAIPSASGPCMDCICGGNGRMKCEPKVCTPEPMIRKMISPSENTTSLSQER